MNHKNTIRNISKEIRRECVRCNISVEESFIPFYVGLLYLDPNYGISANVLSNRDAVVNFVKLVVDELKNQTTPYFITLKLQWYFNEYFLKKKEVVERKSSVKVNKLFPIKQKIITTTEETLKSNALEMEKFRKRIVSYAILISGLGNPMVEAVYLEGVYALKSLFSDEELIAFTNMTAMEKEAEIKYITKLIAGIRLFNKDCSKGGEGIPDLQLQIQKTKTAIKQQLEIMLNEVMEKIDALTTILENCYSTQIKSGRKSMVMQPPYESTKDDIEYVKDVLVAFRQYEAYMRKLLFMINSGKINILITSMKDTLDKMRLICKNRVAVSSVRIFPLFEKLSNIWFELQNEGLYILHISSVIKYLTQFISILIYPEEKIKALLCGSPIVTEKERMERTNECELSTNLNPDIIKIVPLEMFRDPDNLFFEGAGMDFLKFALSGGALIPGNKQMGVVIVYKSVKCIFSDVKSFEVFSEDINEVISRIAHILRKQVMFIEMFGFRKYMEQISHIKVLYEEEPEPINTQAEGNQTDTHLGSTRHIDFKYKWNIWDYKREALQLANLTHCKTTSTQTEIIYNMCPVQCQTFEAKNKCLQTNTDNYSNVPKPSRFIWGLRGEKSNKQFDIELTRPVNE